MLPSFDPLVYIGMSQVIALAAIFVRLGRVFEKSETNRQLINSVKDRVETLEAESR